MVNICGNLELTKKCVFPKDVLTKRVISKHN